MFQKRVIFRMLEKIINILSILNNSKYIIKKKQLYKIQINRYTSVLIRKMTSNENKLNNEKDIARKTNELQLQTELLKFMTHITRFRLISFLLIYPKLSLSDLHKKLTRSKATITHHLKKIENFNIINSSTVSAQGSIDAKIYEILPIIQVLNSFNFSELNEIDLTKQLKIISSELKRDNALFEVLKYILDQGILINKGLDKTIVII